MLNADTIRCTDYATCPRNCPMGLDMYGVVRKGNLEKPDCIFCASCADPCP